MKTDTHAFFIVAAILWAMLLLAACGDSGETPQADGDADVADGDQSPPDYTKTPVEVPLVGEGDRHASIMVDLATLEMQVLPGRQAGAALLVSCFGASSSDPIEQEFEVPAAAVFGQQWAFKTYAPGACTQGESGRVIVPATKDKLGVWTCASGLCDCGERIQMIHFEDSQSAGADWLATLTLEIGVDCARERLLLDALSIEQFDHPAFEDGGGE